MANTPLDSGVDDGWPWNCAQCGRTIYHDAVHCKPCKRQSQRGTTQHTSLLAATHPDALLQWIERQSYPSLVATSSAIASVELLLTALWLRVLFLTSTILPAGLPLS